MFHGNYFIIIGHRDACCEFQQMSAGQNWWPLATAQTHQPNHHYQPTSPGDPLSFLLHRQSARDHRAIWNRGWVCKLTMACFSVDYIVWFIATSRKSAMCDLCFDWVCDGVGWCGMVWLHPKKAESWDQAWLWSRLIPYHGSISSWDLSGFKMYWSHPLDPNMLTPGEEHSQQNCHARYGMDFRGKGPVRFGTNGGHKRHVVCMGCTHFFGNSQYRRQTRFPQMLLGYAA